MSQQPDPTLTTKLASLDLQGVTISARIDADGNLHPVEGGFDKLLSASQKRSLPRIHTMIVSADAPKLPAVENQASSLRIIPAHTIDDAIHLLLVDQQNRWGAIPDYGDLLRRHRNFVGRQWLRDRVNAAIEQALADPDAPPYILITGRPGTGKTAFVANQVQNSPAAVYHFLRREVDQDSPETMLRSLTRQLRRTHALESLKEEEDNSPAQAFYQVLQRASEAILYEETGERQVVWIDGLDEAFGPIGRFRETRLDSLLPLRGLPPGVVFVLTSRPDGPLGWLSDPLLFQRIDLDENRALNLADIHQYLLLQDRALGLHLDPGLLQRLAQASEGCFVAAVRYLHPGPHLQANLDEWQQRPERIPSGLDGWLNYQWQVLLSAAAEEGIPERVVYGVLGMIAVQEGIASQPAQGDLFRAMPRLILLFLQPDDFEEYLEPVLALSSEFFEPQQPGAEQSRVPRFFHSQFAEFIRNKVVEESQKAGDDPVAPVPAAKSDAVHETAPGVPAPLFWLAVLVIGLLLSAGALYGLRQIWPPLAGLPPERTETAVIPSSTNMAVLPSATPEAALPPPSPSPSTAPPTAASSTPLPDPLAQVISGTSLYASPEETSPVLSTLRSGSSLRLFGRSEDGNWLVVIYLGEAQGGSSPAPQSGWVRANDILLPSPLDALPVVLPGASAAQTATHAAPGAGATSTPPPPPTPYP